MDIIDKKSKTNLILNAVANAFKAYAKAFKYGNDQSVSFSAFLSSLDKELIDYEIEYDHLLGGETELIGGETKNYTPKLNDVILLDISVKHQGVWCDVTRAFFVGGYTKEQKERFELIKKTIAKGEKELYNGNLAENVYKAVNKVYEENGLNLVHHAGHLIADAPVSEPRFILGEPRAINTGDIVAIESGVYLDGFGIRLENDYLITDSGYENLSEELMPLDIDNYVLKI